MRLSNGHSILAIIIYNSLFFWYIINDFVKFNLLNKNSTTSKKQNKTLATMLQMVQNKKKK